MKEFNVYHHLDDILLANLMALLLLFVKSGEFYTLAGSQTF